MSPQEVATLNGCIGHLQGLALVLPFYHSGKSQAMIDKATKSLEVHFGSQTINKPDVTTHEAGHGVIAHLVGYRVKNIGVWLESGDRWTGSVEVDDSNSGKPGDAWLWREALVRIAGYIAERLAGKDHPARTVHEKLHCLAIGRYFGELYGAPANHYFTRAINQCQEALEANQEILEEISWRLLAMNRVRGAEISSLMEGAVPLPANLLYESTYEPSARGNREPN